MIAGSTQVPGAQPPSARWRFPVALTACFLAALAMLVALGLWQVQRLSWKTQLLSDLQARQASPAMPLHRALDQIARGEDLQFQPVIVSGRYLHDAQVSITGVRQGAPGWRVVTPFLVAPRGVGASAVGAGDVAAADGLAPAPLMVLVERGFVPGFSQDPAPLAGPVASGGPEPLVTVEAQIRPTERVNWLTHALTPAPDLDRGVFYRLDRAQIAARARGMSGRAGDDRLEADLSVVDVIALRETPAPSGLGELERTRIEPADISNRHLEYVVTWFGLAAALTVIYGAMVVGRWRHRA